MPGIKDIQHGIDFEMNILCVSKICDNFFDVIFKRDICHIRDKEIMLCWQVEEIITKYVMFSTTFDHAMFTVSISDSKLWHGCLGYVNYKTLVLLTSKEIVKGLPKLGRV